MPRAFPSDLRQETAMHDPMPEPVSPPEVPDFTPPGPEIDPPPPSPDLPPMPEPGNPGRPAA
jgi:hypothetical protein